MNSCFMWTISDVIGLGAAALFVIAFGGLYVLIRVGDGITARRRKRESK